jgi:hypothetical protein
LLFFILFLKLYLSELIDIIISEKTKLFVSAVGIPPKWVVDKLHAAGTQSNSEFKKKKKKKKKKQKQELAQERGQQRR